MSRDFRPSMYHPGFLWHFCLFSSSLLLFFIVRFVRVVVFIIVIFVVQRKSSLLSPSCFFFPRMIGPLLLHFIIILDWQASIPEDDRTQKESVSSVSSVSRHNTTFSLQLSYFQGSDTPIWGLYWTFQWTIPAINISVNLNLK